MRKEFLGRGWSFPFSFDPASGGVEMSEYERNIQECISVILGTRPGERQMLPEFGCRIHDLMFSPNTVATSSIVAHHVEDALERWEPRINVTKVDAFPDGAGTIRLTVHYKVKSTLTEEELQLAFTGG